MSIRQIQEALKGMGYDPGPIDGVNGPRTRAAIKKFQEANGLNPDGVWGPKTTAAYESRDSGETSTKPSSTSTTSSIEAAIEENFPTMAWALDHPELGDILRRAGEEEWTALRLQGELQGTDWWQTHSANQRELQILKETDPAAYDKRVEAAVSRAYAAADDVGIALSSASARHIGLQILTEELDPRQITQAIFGRAAITDEQLSQRADAGTYGGGISEAARQVETVLQDHLLTLDSRARGDWIRRIVSGQATAAQLEQFAQRQALAQMPWTRDFLDQGLSPREGLAPYKSTFSRMLEINPNEIDFSDPKYQNALKVQEGNTTRLATTSELSANIRETFADEWNKTSNAKQNAAQLTGRLAQMFGTRG